MSYIHLFCVLTVLSEHIRCIYYCCSSAGRMDSHFKSVFVYRIKQIDAICSLVSFRGIISCFEQSKAICLSFAYSHYAILN